MDRLLISGAIDAMIVAVLVALAFAAHTYRIKQDKLRRRMAHFKRLYADEKRLRLDKHEQVNNLGRRVVELESQAERHLRDMSNIQKVMKSPLYREALEDKQTAFVQAAAHLRLADEEVKVALEIMDARAMLNGDKK